MVGCLHRYRTFGGRVHLHSRSVDEDRPFGARFRHEEEGYPVLFLGLRIHDDLMVVSSKPRIFNSQNIPAGTEASKIRLYDNIRHIFDLDCACNRRGVLVRHEYFMA